MGNYLCKYNAIHYEYWGITRVFLKNALKVSNFFLEANVIGFEIVSNMVRYFVVVSKQI